MPMMVPSLMWFGTCFMLFSTRKVTLSTTMATPEMNTNPMAFCHETAVVGSDLTTRPYVKNALSPRPGAITKGRLPTRGGRVPPSVTSIVRPR